MATFKETQALSPWIKWPTIVLTGGILLFGIAFGGAEDFAEQPIAITLALLGATLAIVMILVLRLEVQLNDQALSYRLFPLEWKTKSIPIEEIQHMEVKSFGILPFYGGFGRRRRLLKKEIAYIMNRKHAFIVDLKDGRKRIFSTTEERKLRQCIEGLAQKNNQHEEI